MKKYRLAILAMVFMGCSCASTGSKFGRIYPGMTSDQVASTMGRGPSRVQSYSKDYSAWYMDEDNCLLFQNDKVVEKASTEEKGGLDIFGYGSMKESKKAECLPPGEKSTRKVEREIETPLGTLRR